jgi:hypothetical protein
VSAETVGAPVDSTEALLSVAHVLADVVIWGGLLCLTIIVCKFLVRGRAHPEIEVLGLKIDLDYSYVLILGLTLAHAFVTYLFLQGIAHMVISSEGSLAAAAFGKLTQDFEKLTPLFELPRRSAWALLPIPVSLPRPSGRDPIMWLQLAMAVAIVPAVVRWRRASHSLRVLTIIASIVLLIANWSIGSLWAIAAGDLKAVSTGLPTALFSTYKIVLGTGKDGE